MKKRKVKIEKLRLNKTKITTLNSDKEMDKIKGAGTCGPSCALIPTETIYI